jgi:exosome complex component CSL4
MTDPDLPKLVLPGEFLGAAEEFLPGPGTYEDRGRIYAAVLGSPSVEPKDRSVRVAARNAIPTITEDELVYARVDELKTAMAICTILATATNPRGIPGTPEGTVHVSKVKDGYTETLSGEFAVGDILLARVLQAHPSVKLTTAPSSLGVVAAHCQVCHALMGPSGKELLCPRCGHREHRKLAVGSLAGIPGPRDGDAH